MIHDSKPKNPKTMDIFFDGKEFWMYLKSEWYYIYDDSHLRTQLRKEKIEKLNNVHLGNNKKI